MSKSRDIADSAATINYIDGLTSDAQTQINNLQTEIDNINPSPTLQAIASGTLANGDTVIVNSDGTVSSPNQTVSANPSIGPEAAVNSNYSQYSAGAADLANNKIVFAYTNQQNSSYPTVVVGIISGDTISFGTPVVLQTAVSRDYGVAFHETQGKFVVIFRGSSGFMYGAVGTVTGDSISFGSLLTINSADSYNGTAVYDASADNVVIAYSDGSNSYWGACRVTTISGTTLSVGSITFLTTSGSVESDMSAAYDSANNACVFMYRRGDDNFGYCTVATVSGTSVTVGTSTQFANATAQYNRITFDASQGRVLLVYNESSNLKARSAIVSGTTITMGTEYVLVASNATQLGSAYDSGAQKHLVIYRDAATGFAARITVTVSGTSLSYGSPLTFHSLSTLFPAAVYDGKSIAAIMSNGVVTSGYVFSYLATDLTSQNYIGISDGAYAISEIANIQIVGSVDDAQSGLTAGLAYYVQDDGSISTSTSDVFAGTAVSSTKIIVKG